MVNQTVIKLKNISYMTYKNDDLFFIIKLMLMLKKKFFYTLVNSILLSSNIGIKTVWDLYVAFLSTIYINIIW